MAELDTFDETMRNRICEEYIGGLSIGMVARKLKVGDASVCKVLKLRGVKTRQRGDAYPAAFLKRAAELYRSGLTLKQTAETLNVPAARIVVALKKAGVQTRRPMDPFYMKLRRLNLSSSPSEGSPS